LFHNLDTDPVADEPLVHYIFSRSHFAPTKGRVKPAAFEVPEDDPALSVYRIQGLNEPSIWVLGQRFAAGGRTLHARAQLTVAQATPPPLVIAREEPPPRHAVVTGWPAAKHERVSFAQRLAADSALFVRPRG